MRVVRFGGISAHAVVAAVAVAAAALLTISSSSSSIVVTALIVPSPVRMFATSTSTTTTSRTTTTRTTTSRTMPATMMMMRLYAAQKQPDDPKIDIDDLTTMDEQITPSSSSSTTTTPFVKSLASSSSSSSSSRSSLTPTAIVPTTATMWASLTHAAVAADSPNWGLFEGRTGSLVHPIMMGSLLLFSLYTALLGFQWRRQRTIGTVIKDKQQELSTTLGSDAKSVAEALAVAKSAEVVDNARIVTLQDVAMPLEDEIQQLQQERKDLIAAGPRDRHFAQGALLACLGTLFAIEGPLNTYARAGKLFPGPHLYVGAGLVCLWAIAVGTVPSMQKGNEVARTIHIAANVTGLALFAWQVQSGLPILFKVVELTKWP